MITAMTDTIIANIENILEYSFNDKSLLEKAFTHSSASITSDYQRMEYLGDSIVGFIVADYLFSSCLTADEGDMTKQRASLVSKDSFFKVMTTKKLDGYIVHGASIGKLSIKNVSDVYESIIAAIYIDGGLKNAKRFIYRSLLSSATLEKKPDFKSIVLEYAAKARRSVEFRVTKSGPDHKPIFQAELYIDGDFVSVGVGGSKRLAEKLAAETAVKRLNIQAKE